MKFYSQQKLKTEIKKMLTPIDIQQMEFPREFRGYNKKEVEDFLDSVSREVEKMIKESNCAKEVISALEDELARYKDKERLLNEAVISAQRISEDIKHNAVREAEIIIKEAQIKAENYLSRVNEEIGRAEAEINYLKKEKITLFEEMKFLLNRFWNTIETEREHDVIVNGINEKKEAI